MVEFPSSPRPHSFPLLRWFPILAVATAFLTIANGALAQQRFRTPDEAVAPRSTQRGPALRHC